jgi:tRNA uridine 5-carboxymethylaminomethyl modification enzyme
VSSYDVIVVGGGHAGCEASAAAARMRCRTLMVTINLDYIGQMSCNPAVGGIGKGHLTREVDAIGGVQGKIADRAAIQFRMLNRRKGPAVWAPRSQADRELYRLEMQRELRSIDGLDFYQGMVDELVVSGGLVAGVRTDDGNEFGSRAVILAAGTFLNGLIHIGPHTRPAGRAGDPPSQRLADHMADLGFERGRFKTGTPPRIDGRTVDLGRFVPQESDPDPLAFSYWERPPALPRVRCWLGYTRARTHEVVHDHERDSPLYSGQIQGRGPRYCPSIEDKVVKFPHNPRHQVFLEPEGLQTTEMYVNGLSTSMPIPVQLKMVRSVDGLEGARMTKPGYAIEYDYYPPHQIDLTLATRAIPNLFFAGQINGTTGYEEAACQGLVAGANAALHVRGEPPLVLSRSESYIGLLVDDLVTRGTDEPYRIFTSRSEYRLSLRQDNADLRLAKYGLQLGLLTREQYDTTERRREEAAKAQRFAEEAVVSPELVNPVLEPYESPALDQPSTLYRLFKRPELPWDVFLKLLDTFKQNMVGEMASAGAFRHVWLESRYEGYLAREERRRAELARMEAFTLPEELDYIEMGTLSLEGREKLERVRPANLGQAARIPGLRVCDLSALLVELARRRSA